MESSENVEAHVAEHTADVLLGAGGVAPQVARWDTGVHEMVPILTLPAGHSAYALSVDPCGEAAAIAGTKGGRLLVIDRPAPDRSDEPTPVRELVQGAPVLSVCVLNDAQIAASDAAGRCCLWNPRDDSRPVYLPTENHVVCALVRLDQDTLVGLATTGAMLFWSLSDNSLAKTVAGPAPPPWSALTPLLHWRPAEVLAYPDADGGLVTYGLGSDDVRSFSAHDGAFYALLEFEGDLITVGRHDGRVKRWRADRAAPSMTAAAPTGVISGAVLCDLKPKLLLVHEDGGAGLHLLGERGLELERPLPGSDYRVVVGPSWDLLSVALGRQHADEARRLALRIQSAFERDAKHCDEEGYTSLERLGYRHVSLALRGQQARLCDDLLGELKAYHELIGLLPADETASLPSLKRYAALLERVWQFGEAQHVLRRAVALDVGLTRQLDRLAPYAEAMSSSCVVIEPDTSIAIVLECAATVGRPLGGRIRVRELEPLSCQGVTLSAEQIAEKYELVRSEADNTALPPAETMEIRWLKRTGTERLDLVTVAGPEHADLKGLQFGLKVLNAGLQTVVVPVVLLDPSPGESQTVAAVLGGSRTRSNGWFSRVHAALQLALRRLINEGLSRRGV